MLTLVHSSSSKSTRLDQSLGITPPSPNREELFVFFDRLASGPKRTFWNSNTSIRIQSYIDTLPGTWTDRNIDRACDYLAESLRPHVGDAPIEFQCATLGHHNNNRYKNNGPRRCLYLELCAVSGRMRAKMGIGCDVDLPQHVRTFLLELPRCAASWE